MQIEGKPKFFRHHERDVRGIAFSPKDRYLFTSGGADGKINIYNAHNASINSLLVSFKLTQQTSGNYYVYFSCDAHVFILLSI